MQHTEEMNVQKRIEAFDKLGREIQNLINNFERGFENEEAAILFQKMASKNGFFDTKNIIAALRGISIILEKSGLIHFVEKYSFHDNQTSKNVAVIMAGNIPAVNFADFLYVLLAGHNFVGKLSSSDPYLMPFLAEMLIKIEPDFKNKIKFQDGILNGFDAVIATGSDNSSRYFEYYFSKYPNIIRKNRTSVAVLFGDETNDEIKMLENDMFSFYGLGCRNVSKIFVPESFNPVDFLNQLEPPLPLTENAKYKNNFEYYKAIYLLNKVHHYDNGQFLLKETADLYPSIGTLHFQKYKSANELTQILDSLEEKLQCVVAKHEISNNTIKPGEAQSPGIFDYPDGVDVGAFLMKIC